MRLIKSPMRSSTGRFGSRYAGNSPPACAESVGTWNSAALTAVTINKNAFFVSTPHLPLPTRANLRVFRCMLGWGMSGFGPTLPLGIMVACALMAPAAEFSAVSRGGGVLQDSRRARSDLGYGAIISGVCLHAAIHSRRGIAGEHADGHGGLRSVSEGPGPGPQERVGRRLHRLAAV